MSANITRKPFTATTWKTLSDDHAYLSAQYATVAGLSWVHTTDLAFELAEMHSHLDIEDTRVMTSFVVSGTPAIVVWETRVGYDRVETTTATCNIEYVNTQSMRITYCGFGHWVQLSDVVSVRSCPTTRTFRTEAV